MKNALKTERNHGITCNQEIAMENFSNYWIIPRYSIYEIEMV